jgi:hypothetical protein
LIPTAIPGLIYGIEWSVLNVELTTTDISE